MPFLYCDVAVTCCMTKLSGAPKLASGPVSARIQPIVISPLLLAPLLLVLWLVLLVEPLRRELQASRSAPPPTTAAPTPAARKRLRRDKLPDGSRLLGD